MSTKLSNTIVNWILLVRNFGHYAWYHRLTFLFEFILYGVYCDLKVISVIHLAEMEMAFEGGSGLLTTLFLDYSIDSPLTAVWRTVVHKYYF